MLKLDQDFGKFFKPSDIRTPDDIPYTYRVHVNDNASKSDHSGVSYRYSIFTLYSHKVSILEANVYVYNLEECLLRGLLLLCYKKLKSS